MSVAKPNASTAKAGNGSSVTPYDVGADIEYEVENLRCRWIDVSGAATELVNGVDFTPTEDGLVTTAVAYPPEETLIFYRQTPQLQGTEFNDTETPRGSQVENSLDELVLMIQELQMQIDELKARAVRVPVGESILELPDSQSRVDKNCAFDSNSDPIAQ